MENIAELIEQMNQTIPGDNQVFVGKRERIMTRKEAQELLKGKKVYVEKHSRELQEKLFEIGFAWEGKYKTVKNINKPFLFFDECLWITHEDNVEYFSFGTMNYEEITAEEIMAIKIEEEPQFKPFKQILYKFEKDGIWKAGLYSHYDGNLHAISGAGYCKYVIPYEGNEDKLGKVTD